MSESPRDVRSRTGGVNCAAMFRYSSQLALAAFLVILACDQEPAKQRTAPAKFTAAARSNTCNIFGKTGEFLPMKTRTEAFCPVCASGERHRLLAHYLEHATRILEDEIDVLHFSANRGLEKSLRAQPKLNYVTADLYGPADLRIDLTDVDQPDASWDVLICYHVLEHITDDAKAMAEMFRILRPGGLAILQVPLEPGRNDTYEDPSIVGPEARLEHYGESTHVRLFGVEDFARRLEAAGFEVEAVDYLATLDKATIDRHRLTGRFLTPRDESIWIARKPAADNSP